MAEVFGVKATPLSYLHTVKSMVDYVKAIVGEYDEQILSDDMVKAIIQDKIMELYNLYPAIRDFYAQPIPFVVDHTATPMVSTVPPASAIYYQPYKVMPTPLGHEYPPQMINPSAMPGSSATSIPIAGGGTIALPSVSGVPMSGMYDYHYAHPENFAVIGWKDIQNNVTGTCRRTSDFAMLQGIGLGNNVLLSRTVSWFNMGVNLWLVVREGMPSTTIITGIALRTVIPLVLLSKVSGDVPTGILTDQTSSPTMDERYRYAPIANEWDKLDCPDSYCPLVAQMTAIRCWGIIGKTPVENVEASVNSQLAQLTASMESANKQMEQYVKENQWKNVGHM
jgi:hypothetical protein